MPPRKRQQSNTMLYTLIAFVGLFIVAAACAVIYYVKAEDYKTKEAGLQRRIGELVTDQEEQGLGTIVGTRLSGRTWLATLAEHFDKAISLATGAVPQDTSAEVKFRTATEKVKNTLLLAEVDLAGADPNETGLTRVIAQLKAELDNAKAEVIAVKDQLADKQQDYDDVLAATLEKEQILLAQKDILAQMVSQNEENYKKLKALVEQTADQRVQNYMAQLEEEMANLETLNQKLLQTEAELDLTEEKMKRAQQEVAAIKPPPDSNAPAYAADGKVILVDDVTKVVHIDLGRDDQVYQGLTFSIYERNAPFPKDGKGKAEIEVFDVAKTFSAAKIISSSKRNPILAGDVVANLIWDSSKENVFVITGEFDLDNDGSIDDDAAEKMKALIEKWGGRVDQAVSVDTDYLVLGKQPRALRKPTFEQLDVDPAAMDKYEASQRLLERYNELQRQAQALWIPIFSYERFLHFTGYKGQISRAGAF